MTKEAQIQKLIKRVNELEAEMAAMLEVETVFRMVPAYAFPMRPEVVEFALVMEGRLAEYDAERGHWRHAPTLYLLDQLANCWANLRHAQELDMDPTKEAADVANYAMMVASVMEDRKP